MTGDSLRTKLPHSFYGPLQVPWHYFTGPHGYWGLKWQGVELRWERGQLLSNERGSLAVCAVMCSSCTNSAELRRTNYNCSSFCNLFWAFISCHSCTVTALGHARFVTNDVLSNKMQYTRKWIQYFEFIILSCDRMTIDEGLDWLLGLLDTYTTLHITVTHRLLFSVAFQRRTFLSFRDHVLAGLRPSHAKLWLLASAGTYFL
jgi:hypothetical protein